MSLRQKAEKIKGIKQSMRKAALVGLASLVTTTALGEEKREWEASSDNAKIPAGQVAESKTDCACYINNLLLDVESPVSQIYKVSRNKAFYSPYLDGGAGGIVFTRFHISDADAFGNANNTYPEKFSKALQDFASRAKKFLVIKAKSKIWTM